MWEAAKVFRDRRDLKALERTTTPDDFPNLTFYSPTRSLIAEMRKGPNREPETREWIDSIPAGSVLWDVGANVGSFSVYAAKLGLKVIAVEPMPHNLLLLARNLAMNGVGDCCTILPLAMSNHDGPALMTLSSLDFGSAGHGFGTFDQFRQGTYRTAKLEFWLTGVTVSTAVSEMGLPAPTHLKVDVDGIDDQVVFGVGDYLSGVQGMCCEVQRIPEQRAQALFKHLSEFGLALSHRTRRNAFFLRA